MKFKDFKKNIQKEEISTPDIKDRIDIHYLGKSKKPRFSFLTFHKIAIPLMLVFAVFAVIVSSISNTGNNRFTRSLKEASSSGLATYESENEFIETLSYKNSSYDLSIFTNAFGRKKATSMASVGQAIEDQANSDIEPIYNGDEVSKTNTQFENVDEADVVKCDDKNIYRVSKGNLLVNSLNNGIIGETRIVSIADQKSSLLTDTLIYLTKKYVIVLSTLIEYEKPEDDVKYDYYYYAYRNRKYFTFVNIYDIQTLKLVKNFKGEGALVDSRIVFNEKTNLETLYLIYIENIKKNKNSYDLPLEIIDGESKVTPFNEIYYSKDFVNLAYTHFVSIKLDDTLSTNSIVQTSPTNYHVVYVNDNSIYLVSMATKYFMELYVRNKINCLTYAESIIKYDIDDGDIKPIASLITSGQILNQFSIDEYKGCLRLALAETNKNKIEIYKLDDNKFKLIGSITEGLGEENEIIKSARFNGDECLVVTAKNTDPLYKIDLSDPERPTIIGKFKEDGFNTYIQYLKHELEGYAFALGYNTQDISEYYNIKTGTKLDLYNIQGDDPVEIDEINYDVIDVEAVYNHKALFVYKNYIGFEVARTYYLYQIVDGDNDLAFKNVINQEYNIVPTSADTVWMFENGYNFMQSRMYYVNGYFYLVYQSIDNSTYSYYGFYESNIISYNLNFEIVDVLN